MLTQLRKNKKSVKWVIFRAQALIFKPKFLSSPLSNLENLSPHQIDEHFRAHLPFDPSVIMKGAIANSNLKSWATSFALVHCS